MDELEKVKADLGARTKAIPFVSLHASFQAMSEILNATDALIAMPERNISNHDAMVAHTERGFRVTVDAIIADKPDTLKLEVAIGNRVFQALSFYMGMRSVSLQRSSPDERLKGNVTSDFWIHDMEASPSQGRLHHWRLIIPAFNTELTYFVETSAYRDEGMIYTMGRIAITIGTNNFNLYEKKHGDKYYFIIDSQAAIDFEEFSDSCFSILLGFGFLSGDFFQDEGFYFGSTGPTFESIGTIRYQKLRPTIRSRGTCNPVYSNPYGYAKDEDPVNINGGQPRVFSPVLFSHLCSRLYSDTAFTEVVLLILESNTSTLVLQPAGYAVALEKMTNIIAEENKGLKPIADKEVAKQFVMKLTEVLGSFEERINSFGNDNAISILKKNIANINKPTNRDKLMRPFLLYGIKLSAAEIEAIDHRNNFLHGNKINLTEGSSQSLAIWAISMRLNKVVNKLILKYLGYSGYIVNHLKHHERSFKGGIDEELFELI